ncbi:MAG TPA: hypothetical protein PK971_05025, partial [Saprospiraceae bacterium]|nr:hypothetical protein [Saprospiraceae bacterium]
GGPGCIIFGILALVLLWFVLKGLYTLLYWAAPLLFVLALIINWRAVSDTGKEFLGLLRSNPLGGVILGAVCVMAFPLLALYLFLRALGHRRLQEIRQQFGDPMGQGPKEEDFADYEEIESSPKVTRAAEEEPIDIPPVSEPEPAARPKVPEQKKPSNPYDQMFE